MLRTSLQTTFSYNGQQCLFLHFPIMDSNVYFYIFSPFCPIFASMYNILFSSMGDFQKNEDFSFSENNLNIK